MLKNLATSADLTVLFDYLFRRINKYEYRDRCSNRAFAKSLWGEVSSNGYVLLNCKLFAYAKHCARAKGRTISSAAFGVDREDVRFLSSLDLSHIPRTYEAMTLDDFQNEQELIFSKVVGLDDYIGKFISKKLIFLVRHYGLDRQTVHLTLLESALFAMRKQYPFFESQLHRVNVCKTAIHNCGITLIQYWTRQKRNALIAEADGTFSAVHKQIELEANTLGHVDPHDDPDAQQVDSLLAVLETCEVTEQHFLQLARGVPDTGFSLFIGVPNDDAVHEWPYDRYLESLSSYLKVDGTSLLNRLKSQI